MGSLELQESKRFFSYIAWIAFAPFAEKCCFVCFFFLFWKGKTKSPESYFLKKLEKKFVSSFFFLAFIVDAAPSFSKKQRFGFLNWLVFTRNVFERICVFSVVCWSHLFPK